MIEWCGVAERISALEYGNLTLYVLLWWEKRREGFVGGTSRGTLDKVVGEGGRFNSILVAWGVAVFCGVG
jgi:hypothetical protein